MYLIGTQKWVAEVVRSLFRALVVLGLSWDERGGVDVVTYHDVTMNDDFQSSFVVQLPRSWLGKQ